MPLSVFPWSFAIPNKLKHIAIWNKMKRMNQRIFTLTCCQNPWNLQVNSVPNMLTLFWLPVISVRPRAVATAKELKLAQCKEVFGCLLPESSRHYFIIHDSAGRSWAFPQKSSTLLWFLFYFVLFPSWDHWITWIIGIRSAISGHLQKVVQGCVQLSFRYFQRWRLQNLPGPPVPVSWPLFSNKNTFYLV